MKNMTLILVVIVAFISSNLLAEELSARADLAVANILFEYDDASDFATYQVNEEGLVDIVFARNMPDALYSELLNKLENDPNIKGVLAGRGGPACTLW